MRRPTDQHPKARSRHLPVAFLCGGFVALMVGVSYAAVPHTIDGPRGQAVTAYYKVTNQAARATVGQAGYNVTPPTVGASASWRRW